MSWNHHYPFITTLSSFSYNAYLYNAWLCAHTVGGKWWQMGGKLVPRAIAPQPFIISWWQGWDICSHPLWLPVTLGCMGNGEELVEIFTGHLLPPGWPRARVTTNWSVSLQRFVLAWWQGWDICSYACWLPDAPNIMGNNGELAEIYTGHLLPPGWQKVRVSTNWAICLPLLMLARWQGWEMCSHEKHLSSDIKCKCIQWELTEIMTGHHWAPLRWQVWLKCSKWGFWGHVIWMSCDLSNAQNEDSVVMWSDIHFIAHLYE